MHWCRAGIVNGRERSRAAWIRGRGIRPGPKSRRHDPHTDPRFRLPEEVIDEEVGYVLGTGVTFRGGVRIDSLKKLLSEKFDAVFVGSGAPRGRDLDLPGRNEAA